MFVRMFVDKVWFEFEVGRSITGNSQIYAPFHIQQKYFLLIFRAFVLKRFIFYVAF